MSAAINNSSDYEPKTVTDEYFGDFNAACKKLCHISRFDQECGILVSLDGQFKIASHLISLGGWKYDIANLDVMFARIISDKTDRFIYAHNHPNGVARFSEEDIRFTIGMLLMSQILRITCVDHILFAYKREPQSFKKKYPKLFNKNWIEYFDSKIEQSMKLARKVI